HGGLKVGIRDLATGLRASIDHGSGKVTLLPTTATIVLAPPAHDERTIPLSLEAITGDVGADDLRGSLKGLATGALVLEAVDVAGVRGEGGERRADVLGLRIDARKINELLGRDVVASDADLELHVDGEGPNARIAASARTRGGTLRVDGSLG